MGKMFTDDVIGRAGGLRQRHVGIPDRLERVAVVSRDVAERYRSDIVASSGGIAGKWGGAS